MVSKTREEHKEWQVPRRRDLSNHGGGTQYYSPQIFRVVTDGLTGSLGLRHVRLCDQPPIGGDTEKTQPLENLVAQYRKEYRTTHSFELIRTKSNSQ